MTFVIFHGAGGSPEGNWFPELKEKLEALGQRVLIPQFPTPENQNLDSWTIEFEKLKKKFRRNDKLCFIGHSLGPLFILHVVSRFNLHLDSAIFVSPFLNPLHIELDKLNETFYKSDFDFPKLQKLIPVSYALYSNNDPYVPSKYSIDFAKKLNSSMLIVREAGHMNSEVNLNEFPLVFELCKTRIDLALYQRYLAHRRDLYSIDYVKGKSEEVIYLKPEEVFDEGIFHFRNLRKVGFCTFYTPYYSFWNTQSKYMEEARKAAKRMKNITRVFILEKEEDLGNSVLQEQMSRDITAGIKVYVCRASDIKDKVPELDFGIWDNDYLCLVHSDKKGEINEIRLSSLKKEIREAQRWSKIILKKSKRISDLSSLKKLVDSRRVELLTFSV